MRLKLVRLLAFAIALAVPIQGMAAVTAGQCMALGHHQNGIGEEAHARAASGASGHDHTAHAHGSDAAEQADDTGGNHCGPCTACCASASIAGPAGISIASSASNAPYVFSQFPPLAVQPDGIDRPPLAL